MGEENQIDTVSGKYLDGTLNLWLGRVIMIAHSTGVLSGQLDRNDVIGWHIKVGQGFGVKVYRPTKLVIWRNNLVVYQPDYYSSHIRTGQTDQE